jgi:DNA primase
MRFPPSLLDDIRARLPVSEVVRRRVTWDRRKSQPAKGDYWACCPFHSEKSPSFHADDRKGIYHCFGCGATGDHVKFVMETEGRSFPEAVEMLAGLAGVAMPAPDPQWARREERRASLIEVVEAAAKFFESAFRGPEGKAARDYAARRRLSPATISEFRVGFAPDTRDALKKHLAALKIDEAQAVEAGLLIRPEDGRPAYDRFRGRLMIPIHDERGRVVAFGGRTLGDGEPKYLNSPETPLFSKGTMLFNAHRAREAAHKAGSIVVTEGYLDAIAVFQSGVKNVVATLGTAFTEEQILRLWRFAPEPVVCFDGDRAGVAAAHRVIERMLPVLKSGFSFNFCFLPDGKDPDDLVAERGRDGFLAAIAEASPLSDVLWEREVAGVRTDTPERKAALEARVDELVRMIRDARVARRYQLTYRMRLSDLFWRSEKRGARGEEKQPGGAAPLLPDAERSTLERTLLGICVAYPDIFERSAEEIMAVHLGGEVHERFRRDLYRVISEFDDRSPSTFYDAMDPRFFFVLDEVHGAESRDEAGELKQGRGHKLAERLPILRYQPAESFVEACFQVLLERLSLKALDDDLEHEISAVVDEVDSETEQRILALGRERTRRQEELARREQELAEEAKLIRSAFGSHRGGGAALWS